MSSWTQAVCANRWNMMRPDAQIDVDAFERNAPKEGGDPCCYCRKPHCVIYVRIDPATVPYPTEQE